MQNKYYLAVQIAIKSLNSLLGLLEKAKTWVEAEGVAESKVLEAKLAPDMHSFTLQVRIASDNAKGFTSRFAGVENPKFEDNEETIEELVLRVEKTIQFLEGFSEDDFKNTDEVKIVLPYIKGSYQTASDYLKDYALANFYFHFVTSYAILRNLGIPLGKMDYIDTLNLKPLDD